MTLSETFRRQIANFTYGQVISILLVCTSIFTNKLQRNDALVVTFSTTFLYVLLALVFLPYFYVKRCASVHLPVWFWVLFGLIDVEANYWAVAAFAEDVNYAILGLILHMTIPVVTILSYFFMGKRYNWFHVVGCVFAVAGFVVIFAANNEGGEFPNQMRGNLKSLLAAGLYALSNLLQEFAVKRNNTGIDANIEVLGKMGVTATIVSLIQMAIISEYAKVTDVDWSAENVGWNAGYVLTMFLFYATVSVFLRVSESLLFNISLLTSDLYSALTMMWVFDGSVPGLYWLAWGLECVGITVYSVYEPIELNKSKDTASDDAVAPEDTPKPDLSNEAYHKLNTTAMAWHDAAIMAMLLPLVVGSSVVGISDSDLFLRHDKFAQPTKAVDFNRFNMTREVVHYETAGDDHDQSSHPVGVSAIIIFPRISLILPLDMRPWHACLQHRRR
ncbi:hypothetical protein DYB38_000836 [Aphanomyces astaci]|uniref:EamA domain-containing protein n=1 Tax=Aphanomyces astaci TaxID=112090 RepID=A0A397DE60_APHAT|nr:hypothetical protein DYB38_000836 [Aphanomyces astaci]